MKEYRIVTHFSGGMIDEPEPWNAFIFEPEFEGQTHDDYIASLCGYLDDVGKLKTGATEGEAVANLFKSVTHDIPCKSETVSIFEKNRSFGEV